MGTTAFDYLGGQNLIVDTAANSPGAAGTTLQVTNASRWPDPATYGAYNVGVAPAAPNSPDLTNTEYVRVTAKSGANLTISRTQEGSTNRTMAAGDVVFLPLSIKAITDLRTAVGAIETPTINAQTASYGLVLTDAGKVIEVANASANTVTIPANASVAFPIGTQIVVRQTGAGATTIAITTDTLNYYSPTSAGTCQVPGQWAEVLLEKRTATAWVVSGAK